MLALATAFYLFYRIAWAAYDARQKPARAGASA
jgi:hypothetical protein